MILTSREAAPHILAAVRDGVLISDDVAQTIAAGLHSPAAKNEQITRLSHRLEFNPAELLTRVDELIKSEEFRVSDVLPDLVALRAWTLARVPHVEITVRRCSAQEWAESVGEGHGVPDGDTTTTAYLVADRADDLGGWVYPGNARYPADTTGHQFDPDDGGVWLPASPVDTAAEILRSTYADFWAQEYTSDGADFAPGGEYTWRDEHPHTGDVAYKTARLVGFSAEDEAAVYAAWTCGTRRCECEHVAHMSQVDGAHAYMAVCADVQSVGTLFGTFAMCPPCRTAGHGQPPA